MIAQTLDTMGTRLRLLIPGPADYRVWTKIRDEILRLNGIFNRFDPASELSRCNGGLEPESDDLKLALTLAEEFKMKTGGLFDVKVSGALDFGGFAKGYALRKAETILRRSGVDDAFISFGQSSILAMGSCPGEEGWKVALTDPYSDEVMEELILRDEALSVSGNSPAYSGHIVNPLTGERCTEHAVVTARCSDALEAEVLTTAAMIADDAQIDGLERNFPHVELKMYLL